jgi:flavin reductase (DIM6/NTAB) family NADH-FMN oxidoreductase RutF
LSEKLQPYQYLWPASGLLSSSDWQVEDNGHVYTREMPETREQLRADSRWPAFFPSSICYVSTTDGTKTALEKVVGPSIVNRFPYVIALSFCRELISERHHARRSFMEILERGGTSAVQFLPPGPSMDRVMQAILTVPEEQTHLRITQTGLATRKAITINAPVFKDAYLVYEAHLVHPGKDFDGNPIYTNAWVDVGSHRLYFLEISAIQLRQDIAEGDSQIYWRSLPEWQPIYETPLETIPKIPAALINRYQKEYTPHYYFPSAGTVAFESDGSKDGMAFKDMPPLAEDQVEVDNDRARWPCFFPSSVGMITTWTPDGNPNVMPCGSTTVVSRHPLIIASCVAYAAINQRYAPRASLDFIRQSGWFGCGVPFISERQIKAIKYSGNFSLNDDPQKVAHSGLVLRPNGCAPILADPPIHFECQVTDEIRLGTHIMFLGKVKRIFIRADLTSKNPLEWCPWADVVPANKC